MGTDRGGNGEGDNGRLWGPYAQGHWDKYANRRRQESPHALRGSSLVSIKPSAFTTGAASSGPGGFVN